ncbi:MAG: signal peptidase II [Defluviitaleaceae bacterium]|nr:signal peptidase II [Defluviitaleaceae bacterium]
MSKRISAWIIFTVSVGVLIGLDLWLKIWAEANLQGTPPRVLIDGFLGLRYFENSGMAFGMLGGHDWSQWVLSIVKIVIMIVLVIYYHKIPLERKYWFTRIPLILIFAGGVGNLIDRITLGVVRDMLEFLFVNFAIFNLADVFVVTGCISWIVFELFIVKDFARK